MSDERKARAVGIETFVLRDIEDNTAPPDKPVLQVTPIGDTVSLAICEWEEGGHEISLKQRHVVIVDFEPLWNGLAMARLSQGQKPA